MSEYNREYLLKIGTKEQRDTFEKRHNLFKRFESQARYLGSIGNKSLYGICGISSSDTADLYQQFIGLQLIANKEVEYDEEELFLQEDINEL